MTGQDVAQIATQHLRAQRRQTIVQGGARLAWADVDRLLDVHPSRIQPFIHLHKRDAGRRVTGQDSMLDGRRATPPRQKRSVDIEAAPARQIEHMWAKNLAERSHDDKVGLPGAQWLGRFLFAERSRLIDRDAGCLSDNLDRRGSHLVASSGRFVRLRNDPNDCLGFNKGLQARHGEFRRAHKDDSCHAVILAWPLLVDEPGNCNIM